MRFWEQVLEAHPILIDAAAHDRQLAWTSHLPQAVAYALAKALADRRLGWGVVSAPARGTPPGSRRAARRCGWTSCCTTADPLVEAALRAWRAGGGAAPPDRGRRSARAGALPRDRPRVSPRDRAMRVAGTVRVPGRQEHHPPRPAARRRSAGGPATSAARSPRSTPAPAPGCSASWAREISPLRAGRRGTVRGRGRLRRSRPRRSTAATPAPRRDCCSACSPAIASAPRSPATPRFAAGRCAGSPCPLAEMGARFEERGGDGLPLTIRGGPLRPIRYAMPVSSAQIKSALLLAGVAGGVAVDAARAGRPVARSHRADAPRLRLSKSTERDGWIELRPDGPARAVRHPGAGRSFVGGVSGRRGGAGRGRGAPRSPASA